MASPPAHPIHAPKTTPYAPELHPLPNDETVTDTAPRLQAGKYPKKILLTNDDGPPGPSSPFMVPFAKALAETEPTWAEALTVLIPHRQRSWIGKGFLTDDLAHLDEVVIKGFESKPWKTLSATPAGCVNFALHHLPEAEAFDLVISGPNFGRNVSSSLTLSSGTVGAALEGALLNRRAISLSFGIFQREWMEDEAIMQRACEAMMQAVVMLWQTWEPEVDVYNVNVPIVPHLIPECRFTHFYTRGRYGSLYTPVEGQPDTFAFKGGLTRDNDLTPSSDWGWLKEGGVSITGLSACLKESGGYVNHRSPFPLKLTKM